MKEKYKKYVLVFLYVVATITSVIIFVMLAKFLGFFGGVDASVTRVISGPVDIGPAGVTFAQSPPLRLERESSKVLLRAGAVRDIDFATGRLLLADGSTRHVSVSLKDEAGRIYALSPISRGVAIGFGFSDSDRETLSKDTVFSSILIRSDDSLSVVSIEWYSWTGK